MITFQHQSDVRRIIMDEFDLPRAAEILREAKREIDQHTDEAWLYAKLVKRAEKLLLYGEADDEGD